MLIELPSRRSLYRAETENRRQTVDSLLKDLWNSGLQFLCGNVLSISSRGLGEQERSINVNISLETYGSQTRQFLLILLTASTRGKVLQQIWRRRSGDIQIPRQ